MLGEVQHVRVPRDLPALSAGELTAWVLLVWRAGRNATTGVSQARLQADMGREGHDTSRVREYVRGLERRGLVETTKMHRGDCTRNTYRPLRRVAEGDGGRRWVELPKRLLVALAAGDAGPEHVLAAYRWLAVCAERGTGWRRESLTVFAAEWGQSVRTVRRHRSVLAVLGVVDVLDIPGQRSVTALPGKLPDDDGDQIDGAGGGLPASEVIPSPAGDGQAASRPRSSIPGHPGQQFKITPDSDPRGTTWGVSTCADLPLDSVPSGTVQVVDAREDVDAARAENPTDFVQQNHETKKRASRTAWAVIASLPRAWRDDCPGWVRRRMAEQIDRAMTDRSTINGGPSRVRRGAGPAAIVAAVTRYGRELATEADSEHDAVRHTRALAAVLTALAGDIAAGACADCGHHHAETHSGHCGCCDRQPSAAATVPPADRTAHGAGVVGIELATPGVCVACERTDPSAVVRAELPAPMSVCAACWAPIRTELAATA